MSRLIFSRFARYLDEIVLQGSVRKAAERLNISASAIDKQLIRAEEELGVPLFERLPRGMRLTAAGEILIHGVRDWHKELDRIRYQIEELKGLRRGEVKIAVAQEAIGGFLPGALATFIKAHPRISTLVTVVDSERVRQLVMDGQAEFGLTFSPQPLPGVNVSRSIEFTLRAMIPATPDNSGKQSISLQDFFRAPTIVPDASTQLRDAVDVLAARILAQPRPVLTTNSLTLMRSMVQEGCGVGLIAVLPDADIAQDGGIMHLPFADRGIPRLSLSLIVAPNRSPSMTSIELRRHLEEKFDQLAERNEVV
ncbi:LysR family transcriptional regulator [Rhizobium sp. PAMB 3182]